MNNMFIKNRRKYHHPEITMNELMDKPFWEKSYQDMNVSTFTKGPTVDLNEYAHIINEKSFILDVGCGEGRNSIFLASKNHIVEAFDISEAGINKAKLIAKNMNLNINFWHQDLAEFKFNKQYDVILSHGVLHLTEKHYRDEFIHNAKENTKNGGYNFIGVFTDEYL